jgi:hypothetical protein
MEENLTTERTLSPDDIRGIPADLLPMMVFSDSMRSFFSWGIKAREKGCYNHFMWYVCPGFFASQDWVFHKVSIEEYLSGNHRLKFVYGPKWTKEERLLLKTKIRLDLEKPWYKNCYDPVQVFGKLIGLDVVQVPGLWICSDRGEYLRLTDKGYDLAHPSPTGLNLWTKARPGTYSVYGRYAPD